MGHAVQVPGYEILGVLAYGGQASVYRARQSSMAGREVAVKVYDRALVTERDRRRFEREVRAAASLSGHRHVIQVYDAGLLPSGQPYLAMELCHGGSLATRLRERGPVPPGEVRAIGIKIAGALATAHAAGVLHRDVKPANVLVTRDGEPVLTDFGIAALLRPGVEQSATLGLLTPAYAPPEMFHGSEPTAAGDVYSLGATLYALLVGRPPRWPAGREPSLAEMFVLYDHPLPEVPGAPAGLLAVLRHAMVSDPARRCPSAAHLLQALAELPEGTGAPYPAGAPVPPVAAEPGRRPDHRPGAPAGYAPGPPANPPAGYPSGPPAGYPSGPPPGPPARAVAPGARGLLGDVALALALVATLGGWALDARGWGAGLALVAAALGMLALAGWGRLWATVAAYAATLGVALWATGGVVWLQGDQPVQWWRPVAWLVSALVIGFAAVLVYDVRTRRW
ncbi:MAG TPA: serine/threonine-protein kinase [Micromonosporaceae bacterium]|nr:serine/threonine-protein kinase [Micromonosporaceae bacterium]